MIAFNGLEPQTDVPQLLAASARHFGSVSYQATEGYLRWLYAENPAASDYQDCIVARRNGGIVGCMHRLVLPLLGGGRFVALHNHFVDPAVRSGSGVLLLLQASKGADIAVAPGVEEKLAPIYRRLRYHDVDGVWLAKPFSYLRVATGIGLAKLGVNSARAVKLPPSQSDIIVTATPSTEQISELRRRMVAKEAAYDGISWTDELVRWRYFHPDGPRHILILSCSTDCYAVVAIGTRRGVRTARLMAIDCSADQTWLSIVEAVSKNAGMALGLAFTTEKGVANALTKSGWKPRWNKTHTFSSPKQLGFISPAATDLGFESFGTEFT